MVSYANLWRGDVAIVQLIELVLWNGFLPAVPLRLSLIEDQIRRKAVELNVREMQNRPQYILPNGVKVEVVKPVHNERFCIANNRIRITHDGNSNRAYLGR